MEDHQGARLSCGSLSPIPLMRTKQCRMVLSKTETNHSSYSYTDLDKLICTNRTQLARPQTASRALPLSLVLASLDEGRVASRSSKGSPAAVLPGLIARAWRPLAHSGCSLFRAKMSPTARRDGHVPSVFLTASMICS